MLSCQYTVLCLATNNSCIFFTNTYLTSPHLFCALPDRERASASVCTSSLDVCCLHPNRCSVLTSNTGNHNQAIDVVYSSTAQYKEDYLEKFGCAPNGGIIKREKVFGDSGLLMAMTYCVESPNFHVTSRSDKG